MILCGLTMDVRERVECFDDSRLGRHVQDLL